MRSIQVSDIEAASSQSAWSGRILTTIEGEIIPRLMLAHRVGWGEPHLNCVEGTGVDAVDVDEFARLLLARDASVAFAYVDMARARGVGLEALLLELMAPAATRLWDFWNDDRCDFAEVTIGMSRLQHLLRELGPAFYSQSADCGDGRRILLASAPGERHSFGIFLTEAFFRRGGWDASVELDANTADLVGIVKREWFSMVGLSLSSARGIDDLAATIKAIRLESRNKSIAVIVGGQIFMEHPELVATVGADVGATDARSAVSQAERMLGLLAMRC
ncbi:cobalamin B12-binding domain-containing protein [Afifella marina]|uniref:Methanogenic corrinoid protein MtbC1 n=1 Tax=Afifella marina DSM 2698 TaxID=1120955 RepID=A0A1G5P1P9_AFIMA|nr:cobalamin B12-binding domain-containing protein [Afifella marina]SCZ43011.1 Methanogenic corrinoid protein MtbC1 [Afifella marina DSM 2698]